MSFKTLVMAEYAIVKDLIASQKEEVEKEFFKWSCWCADTPEEQELVNEFYKKTGGPDLLWDKSLWPERAYWIAPMRKLIALEQLTFELGHYIK